MSKLCVEICDSLWIRDSVRKWFHGEFAERPEHEESVLLQNTGKVGFLRSPDVNLPHTLLQPHPHTLVE
jgi:hypothetical protein